MHFYSNLIHTILLQLHLAANIFSIKPFRKYAFTEILLNLYNFCFLAILKYSHEDLGNCLVKTLFIA